VAGRSGGAQRADVAAHDVTTARAVLAEFVRPGWFEKDEAAAMLAWPHSGFGAYVGQRIEDREVQLRVARYAARAPVAEGRLRYDAERAEVELVPDRVAGAYAGVHRMPALEFIARWVDHVPERYEVRVRYAGAYATRRRRAYGSSYPSPPGRRSAPARGPPRVAGPPPYSWGRAPWWPKTERPSSRMVAKSLPPNTLRAEPRVRGSEDGASLGAGQEGGQETRATRLEAPGRAAPPLPADTSHTGARRATNLAGGRGRPGSWSPADPRSP
jgi:hypothetical protein